jgi:hypothetical protein
VLQLSVGTANIFGDLGAGGGGVGLNVAATYRQGKGSTSPGDSGTAVNSPTLTVAGALPEYEGSPDGHFSTIETGPTATEAGGAVMTSTPQNALTPTTFGTSGQVSGLGIEPFNYAVGGSPDSNIPYPVPIYDNYPVTAPSAAPDPDQLPAAWGGPPSFLIDNIPTSVVNTGNVPSGTAGVSLGLDVFEGVTPVGGGAYTLSLSVPANTGTITASKSFTLPTALTVLPAITPSVPTLDVPEDGGATFAITLPAGVTEAYIEIENIGPTAGVSCNGAATTSPVYYTIKVTASGSYQLAPLLGPGATESICTAAANTTANGGTATSGDQFFIDSIGFDYPWYEASYPQNFSPSPAILGANGEDDITISSLVGYVEEAPAQALRKIPMTRAARARSLGVHRAR